MTVPDPHAPADDLHALARQRITERLNDPKLSARDLSSLSNSLTKLNEPAPLPPGQEVPVPPDSESCLVYFYSGPRPKSVPVERCFNLFLPEDRPRGHGYMLVFPMPEVWPDDMPPEEIRGVEVTRQWLLDKHPRKRTPTEEPVTEEPDPKPARKRKSKPKSAPPKEPEPEAPTTEPEEPVDWFARYED